METPIITGIDAKGVRISRLVSSEVTVKCRDCGKIFTSKTNEHGGITHFCPEKPKGYYCGFLVEESDLVPSPLVGAV